MKKAKLIALFGLVLAMGVTGCNNPGTSTPNPSTPSSTPSASTPASVWEGKTNEDFARGQTTYVDGLTTKPLTMNTLYTNGGHPHLDSMGDSNVLVVPFGFTDSNLQEVQSQENIERIERTFFGDPGDNNAEGWMSLKTFYETSSYGKIEFKGKVVPTWVNCGKTASAYVAGGGGGPEACEIARSWYLTEYNKAGHGALGEDAEPLTYFDKNNDGYIDLIWIVYSHPFDNDAGFWAYKTYTNNAANKVNPAVKTLAWASITFMDNGFNGHDQHTFVHETGHTYGLDDYYDYKSTWKPMGGIDYMDQNLGDHSMFSKFSLGWVNPWVVNDTALITLRPGTTTGDCFIIPSPNYNGTAFDEYIMVELMAPVGLAEYDYKNGYSNTNGYSQPGLRISHIDARLVTSKFDGETTENPQNGKGLRVSNTYGGRAGVGYDSDYWPHEVDNRTEKGYYTLTSIFESDYTVENNWTNQANYNASNRALFRKNHTFDLDPNVEDGWAEVFMPSRSNLWNKAKVNTSRSGTDIKEVSIDETCTFNYEIQVLSIKEDAESGYVATVKVIANAY